jgi:Fur family zinc uptake transcriptional regulator
MPGIMRRTPDPACKDPALDRSRNESLVYDYLEAAGKPASAYDILDALRDQGLRAPLQVYRALTKLIESGAVHRIESLNAFVACKHHACGGSEVSIFMLCERCDQVTEALDTTTAAALASLCSARSFTGTRQMIEITGVCKVCQTAQH